jgi:hypothetical protein
VVDDNPGPSHGSVNGKSIRITSGFRLVIEFKDPGLRSRFETRNYYWKHGIHHDAHRWLKARLGEQCGDRSIWDDENLEDGLWIYLGSQLRKQRTLMTATLQFRNKADALLFKLTWNGFL